jgi:hypothetical protein
MAGGFSRDGIRDGTTLCIVPCLAAMSCLLDCLEDAFGFKIIGSLCSCSIPAPTCLEERERESNYNKLQLQVLVEI